MPSLRALLLLTVLALLTAACASPVMLRDGAATRATLASRTGSQLHVDVDDGLEEAEAVALALDSNPEFAVALARLGLSSADLAQAGLLKNPVLSLLFPVGPKQFESALSIPLDALWTRPHRVALATLDLEQVAHELEQEGLTLIAKTRGAYLEAVLARELRTVAARRTALLAEQLRLETVRVEAGDVSAASLPPRKLALQAAKEVEHTLDLRTCRAMLALRGFLGVDSVLSADHLTLVLDASRETAPAPELDTVRKRAAGARPDVRAAELGVERAALQCALSKRDIAAVQLVLDANGSGLEGFESGPGLVLELPVFDNGQARRAKARVELEQAVARHHAVYRQLSLQVEEARLGLVHARLRRRRVMGGALRVAMAAEADARAAKAAGESSQVELVAAQLAVVDAESRAIESAASERLARIQLDHAVGRTLEP